MPKAVCIKCGKNLGRPVSQDIRRWRDRECPDCRRARIKEGYEVRRANKAHNAEQAIGAEHGRTAGVAQDTGPRVERYQVNLSNLMLAEYPDVQLTDEQWDDLCERYRKTGREALAALGVRTEPRIKMASSLAEAERMQLEHSKESQW